VKVVVAFWPPSQVTLVADWRLPNLSSPSPSPSSEERHVQRLTSLLLLSHSLPTYYTSSSILSTDPSTYHRRPWRRERPRPTQWARETGCPTSSKSCRAAQQPQSTSSLSTYTCAMCSGAWTIWTSGKSRTCRVRHAQCAHGLADLVAREGTLKDVD